MTKDQWLEREKQWKGFHEWESKHAADSLSPQERLAEVGALVDLILARQGSEAKGVPDLRAATAGIVSMRRCLACLVRAA